MRFLSNLIIGTRSLWLTSLCAVVGSLLFVWTASPGADASDSPRAAVESAPAEATNSPAPTPEDNEVAWSRWLAEQIEGDAEHVLFNGRRVDVLTSELAIEVEWCKREKAAEAVEQASYYGVATGRPGAIVLLTGRDAHKTERVAYDLVVAAAVRGRVQAVAVIDVRNPDVGACCEHLGLVPNTYRGPVKED